MKKPARVEVKTITATPSSLSLRKTPGASGRGFAELCQQITKYKYALAESQPEHKKLFFREFQ
jgi:hypothetical protein